MAYVGVYIQHKIPSHIIHKPYQEGLKVQNFMRLLDFISARYGKEILQVQLDCRLFKKLLKDLRDNYPKWNIQLKHVGCVELSEMYVRGVHVCTSVSDGGPSIGIVLKS